MIAKKAAYVVAGAVMGVVATTTVGFVGAGDTSSAAQPRKKSTAMVVLSGDKGRYLQFTGKETRPAAFKGSVVFKRPITTGAYTLSLTLKGPAGDKTKLVYDVQARQR